MEASEVVEAMVDDYRDGTPITDDGVRVVEEARARSALRAALEAAHYMQEDDVRVLERLGDAAYGDTDP